MPTRVLLIDDDQMLLSSMERCLGLQFDLVTVQSGLEALRVIEESEPFPVIVSDMRMPVMDGIQFIERAREISESSVFMMLTGNQDVQTAIRAVNEGHVFRFLNKPTAPEDIAAAIESAARQHDLENAERILLNKTFVGAVAVFADVMEMLKPELLGRAAQTVQLAEQLRDQVGAPPRWELKIAAKLALVGAAMQAHQDHDDCDSAESGFFASSCEISSRLVERIPRLSLVSRIIRSAADSDGDLQVVVPRGEGDVVHISAAILRTAGLIEAMSFDGIAIEEAEANIQRIMPGISVELLKAAIASYPSETLTEFVHVDIDDLRAGMVLHETLSRADGAALLQAGRRLSETHIDKLRAEKAALPDFPPVAVTTASFRACYPEATTPA